MKLHSGTVLGGKYRVDRPLAEGGTSRLYLGNPLRGAGMVAIKQLLPAGDAAERADDLRHFRAEYEILSSLTHPSLPMALDQFEENGAWYLVEEFIPGETLQAVLERQGRLEHRKAMAIGLQLLDVLGYLHGRGIIYRDVKPENILITRKGALRLIDFGASRRWKPGSTRDTVPLGTPGFASPEHYGSAQTDARSDLYSTGAVLHFMLTGQDPTRGLPWKFAPPEQVVPGIPSFFSEVVMRALELDPEARYQSARAMRVAILYPPDQSPDAPAAPRRPLQSPSLLLRALTGPLPLLPPSMQRAPVQHPRLGALERRLRFNEPFQYFLSVQRRPQVVAWLGIVGLLLATIAHNSGSDLFDRMGMLLFLGAGVFASLWYLVSYIRWRLYRNLVVDIYEDGIAISSPAADAFRWDEIDRLSLISRRTASAPYAAELHGAGECVAIDAAWPGFTDVIDEIIYRAGLVENGAACSSSTATDTLVTTYARP